MNGFFLTIVLFLFRCGCVLTRDVLEKRARAGRKVKEEKEKEKEWSEIFGGGNILPVISCLYFDRYITRRLVFSKVNLSSTK